MTRYLATLVVVCSAACSTEKPAESAYDASYETDADSGTQPGNQPALTPASSDASTTSTTATVRESDRDGDPQETMPPSGGVQTTPAAGTAAAATPATGRAETTGGERAAPDNTKVNERDRNEGALTPGDQGENSTDLGITQRIRQALMGDQSLSMTAKNVKVITRNGKVTLRGPVRSSAERASVEAAARNVAGAANVDSQLEIAK